MGRFVLFSGPHPVASPPSRLKAASTPPAAQGKEQRTEAHLACSIFAERQSASRPETCVPPPWTSRKFQCRYQRQMIRGDARGAAPVHAQVDTGACGRGPDPVECGDRVR